MMIRMNADCDSRYQQASQSSRIPWATLVVLAWLGLMVAACARSTPPGSDAPATIASTRPPATAAAPAGLLPTPLPPTETPSATLTRPPLPTATSLPATSTLSPTPLPLPLRTQILLEAAFDYAQHRLAVTQTITYANHTGETLPELLLVVEPNRRPGVFRLADLRWGDGRAVTGAVLEGARLRVPLPEPLPPETSMSLTLVYDLTLPAKPGPLGYSIRQTNLGDWYPIVPPYRPGQGWVVHEPAEVGEHTVYDPADIQVDLRLVDAPSDLVIAASAPAQVEGNHRRYRMEAGRSLALSASPEFEVLQGLSGPVAVQVAVFPEHRAAGQAALEAISAALSLYGRLFAPYPHASLSMVEADFFDGMEYDGLFFLGQEYVKRFDGSPRNYLTALSAHETAHQWWYGLVGNDQALEPWLDEALCTYSELLFYEAVYPDLVDWWWAFRVDRFQPAGWVDSTIYEHAGFRPYVNAVYLGGAQFLQAVRDEVGDEAFLAMLADYAGRFSNSQASAGDFFDLLGEAGVSDVLFGPYFRGK